MFTRLSHVGIVVKNLEQSAKLWTESYGLKVSFFGKVPQEGMKNAILPLPLGETFIELMEPYDQEDMSNALARRLARRGEGVYQLALLVDDAVETGKILKARGVELIERAALSDTEAIRWVIHPKCASGVLLELIEAPRPRK